jgi:uncharacterized protein (TIGR02391 family)
MQGAAKPQHAGNWFIRLTGLYDPPLHTREPQPRRRNEFELATAEAVAWLISKGLVANYYDGNYAHQFVTRRGRTVDTDEAFRLFLRESALHPILLHPIVRAEAWPLYLRGKFDLAVFEAFKRVEIAVRAAGNFKPTDLGPSLMRMAFHENTGALADMSLPVAERQSISSLFAGAIGAFKNPGSHREVGLDDPTRAAELLMFASHLHRIVDDRVNALSVATAV